MNIFDTLIVQPIFNLLVFIYGIIPGHDFGIALIIFTVIIRLLMWPLVKKQLHQTKIMRQIQPELQRIKKRTKGNKQLEAQLMMELYREKGINPFGSIGLLILQLPIFIALFSVVNLITNDRGNIAKYTYGFIEQLPYLKDVLAYPDIFHANLLGVVNLTEKAIGNGTIYWPIMVLALLAAILQYFQAKQLAPEPNSKRRLRDVLKEQAAGKEVDQSEVGAIVSNRMLIIFPFIAFIASIYFAGALVLYLVASTAVAIAQQTYLLRQDVEEMEESVEQKPKKASTKVAAKVKAAKTAEIVESAPAKSKTKKRKGKKK